MSFFWKQAAGWAAPAFGHTGPKVASTVSRSMAVAGKTSMRSTTPVDGSTRNCAWEVPFIAAASV